MSAVGTFESCTCEECVSCCERNPGWMTVGEAGLAIDAGHGDKLMLDWWLKGERDILLLCPAASGHEGGQAPAVGGIFNFDNKGKCTLLTVDKKYEIHDSGFKPLECSKTLGCAVTDKAILVNRHRREHIIAAGWDTDMGRALIEEWKQRYHKGDG